jgi:hypothetical protein
MSEQFAPNPAALGYAAYTPLTLRLYDLFALGFCNRFIWRCESRELMDLYHCNVSDCHLDVGVGTGYFLDRAQFSSSHPSITLLDANPACLLMASHRIARYAPRIVQANVLDPLPALGPFSSIALYSILHCLPGSIPAKAIVFDRMKAEMAPGAIVFGATIVPELASRSVPAQVLLNFYNALGIVANVRDTVEDLESELSSRFCKVKVRTRGCFALFEAQHDEVQFAAQC